MVFSNRKYKSRLKKYNNNKKKPGIEGDSSLLDSNAALQQRLSPSIPSSVPSKIFQNRSFSILETLVVYLKDTYQLKFRQIGKLLHRNERTIWTCYHRAQQKKFSIEEHHPESITIPLAIFHQRNISFSEALIQHCKKELKLSYHQIGVLLNRNDRTIWTLYARLQKKLGGGQHE